MQLFKIKYEETDGQETIMFIQAEKMDRAEEIGLERLGKEFYTVDSVSRIGENNDTMEKVYGTFDI